MRQARILINTRTWAKDTYDLFDYECRVVKVQNFRTTEDGVIVRSGNSVEFLEENSKERSEEGESKMIAKVEKIFSKFSIDGGLDKDLWIVVNQLKDGHELQDSDIIKLGRVKLRVKIMKKQEFLITAPVQSSQEIPETCKICFSEEDLPENPLIAPCSCTGSLKYIHLKCIKSWLDIRSTKSIKQNSSCIFWKNMDCEICMKPFLVDFFHSNELNSATSDVLALECIDKDKSNARGVYLIQCSGNEIFKLGRGHESDIKFFDISVSRVHAMLEYSDGKYVIRDHKSKFGTLVYLDGKMDIEKTCCLQSGRTLVTLSEEEDGIL